MTRKKVFCKHCGKKIPNPSSQYQEFCDNCREENKKTGGEIAMAEKKKAATKSAVKASPKTDREQLASKVVSYMKNDLKIAEDEMLKVNHSVWLKLKGE